MQTLLRFLQNGKTQFHVAALAKEFLDAHTLHRYPIAKISLNSLLADTTLLHFLQS